MPTEDAMRFAEEHHLAFIETSALDASGVDTAFHRILTGEESAAGPAWGLGLGVSRAGLVQGLLHVGKENGGFRWGERE